MRPLRQRNGSRVIVSLLGNRRRVFYVKTQIGRPSGAVTLSTGDSLCLLVVDIILDEFGVQHLALTS